MSLSSISVSSLTSQWWRRPPKTASHASRSCNSPSLAKRRFPFGLWNLGLHISPSTKVMGLLSRLISLMVTSKARVVSESIWLDPPQWDQLGNEPEVDASIGFELNSAFGADLGLFVCWTTDFLYPGPGRKALFDGFGNGPDISYSSYSSGE